MSVMTEGELDLYPRARYSAYRSAAGSELMCARCACDRWGIRSLWRALHGYQQEPSIDTLLLSRVLPEEPGACCTACGGSFWGQLPKGRRHDV